MASIKRGREQFGIGTADYDYEKFHGDLENLKAEYIRALEKGNISRSDIDFFLAGWPKPDMAPTAARARFQAALEFAHSRLEGLRQEFRPGDTTPKERNVQRWGRDDQGRPVPLK